MSIEAPPFVQSDLPETPSSERYHQIGQGSCSVILCKLSLAYFVVKWEINPPVHLRIFDGDHLTTRQWPNLSHDPSIGLANDWHMHELVFKYFQQDSTFTQNIRIPRPFAYVHQNDWRWIRPSTFAGQMPPAQSEPRDILISQRIPPVPVAVRETLINAYCPQRNKARCLAGLGDQVCLIRCYLGKRRLFRTKYLQNQEVGLSKFFSLSNFKMYFDQMIDLELHVSFIVSTVADALAVMHWNAQIDARDVEFVLGGVPGDDTAFLPVSKDKLQEASVSRLPQGQQSHMSSNSSVIDFKGHGVCMWLLGFNQCHTLTMDENGVKKAVDAYFVNDPYYPRPPQTLCKPQNGALPEADSQAKLLQLYEDEENWSTFRDRYLATSAELLKDSVGYQHLPQMFIASVMDEQMERFTKRGAASAETDAKGAEPFRHEQE